MTQSEQQLENTLISQLETLGFAKTQIVDSDGLEANLKLQLEIFNDTQFTDGEFAKILNHLNKGDRFDKSKSLRDRFLLVRDDETSKYIIFFNMDKWCKNQYQVTNQITQTGKYTNRYDVTLLINGLPLVQIELKRRGLEMKEAFNQIQGRYQTHSFGGSLFEFVQIFVISNGVNTKYFANNPKQPFAQTFFWTDENNTKITQLSAFAEAFLEKCMLSSMIAEYIVLNTSQRIPMILRPYQYYAVKAIKDRVLESDKNGYIWHTTGSGKTLTSFKTSQVLTNMPEIKKVIFVVDRKDLDIQTTAEFNSFSDGSVDGTENTKNLVKQLADSSGNSKLIVTTIQKMDIAIGRESYKNKFEYLADEKVVIIFDECHRSQFGTTHKNIKKFFNNAQLFGFTGTPIFSDNHNKGVTTKDVFDQKLHSYIITDAIADDNVLGFVVEYVGKYKQKPSDGVQLDIDSDVMVEGIDTKEVLESDDRLGKISDYVLSDWRRKTKGGKFNAIFAVSSVTVLKKYYTLLKQKKSEGFRLATIFTYKANGDNESLDNGLLDRDVFADTGSDKIDQHSRDFLEDCINDFNSDFGTSHSTDKFYNYYKDLQKKVKSKEIDMILVVNMFLTGFDSKHTNTLYVDKNLRYHGLIQAYSRTNRLLGSQKPHGNIVAFRNLRKATNDALALFGDENAKEIVFKEPYEAQKQGFDSSLASLRKVAPTLQSIDQMKSEDEKARFVVAFRDLLRAKSSLQTFSDFSFVELDISEQEFADYESKYWDIYHDRKHTQSDNESILDQVDFELELMARDNIDFDYIIELIVGLKDSGTDEEKQKKMEAILKMFERDVQLQKRKDLILKFIEEALPNISESVSVRSSFQEFFETEMRDFVQRVSIEQNISEEKIFKMIESYNYNQKFPRDQEIVNLLSVKPKIMERGGVVKKLKSVIENIIDRFVW